MKLRNFFVIMFFSLIIRCTADTQKDNNANNAQLKCKIDNFISANTGGAFCGKTISLGAKKAWRAHRYLLLEDVDGDTVSFYIHLDNTDKPTKNVIEEKLETGSCVRVYYETDIVEEDGIELNRFYYADSLEYLN